MDIRKLALALYAGIILIMVVLATIPYSVHAQSCTPGQTCPQPEAGRKHPVPTFTPTITSTAAPTTPTAIPINPAAGNGSNTGNVGQTPTGGSLPGTLDIVVLLLINIICFACGILIGRSGFMRNGLVNAPSHDSNGSNLFAKIANRISQFRKVRPPDGGTAPTPIDDVPNVQQHIGPQP